MLASLDLSQISEDGQGGFNVRLKYNQRTRDCQLREPQSLNERLKWLYERYPLEFPYEREKAESIAIEIDEYGESLLQQLGLVDFVESSMQQPELDLITLDIHGSPALHQLRWEALEKPYHKVRPSSMPRILVRRKITSPARKDRPDIRSPSLGVPERTFNILLVVSRPDKQDDIDPLLSSGAIMDIIKLFEEKGNHSPLTPRIEIARPGTWSAFAEHLRLRTDQWHENGGQGPWFDLVHFDVHGSIQNGQACLHFLTKDGKKTLAKTARAIGECVSKYEVPFVLLNACDSAYLTGETTACMARILVEEGVHTVMAMSFKLTSSAAKTLIRAFYFRLLAPLLDSIATLWVARTSLARNVLRTGRFNVEVDLNDYIIPVIFASSHANVDPISYWSAGYWRQNRGTTYQSLHERDEEFAGDAWNFAKVSDTTHSESLIGREYDILELEWILLRGYKSNVIEMASKSQTSKNLVVMTGAAGVGKTALVEFLASWWKSTGLVQRVQYWRMSQLFDSMNDDPGLQVKHPRLFPLGSDEDRHLYIVDQIESQTQPYSANALSAEQRINFLELVNFASSGNRLLVLVSRQGEDWLNLPKRHHYKLQGLAHYDATIFASRTMTEIGMGNIFSERENAAYLESLLYRCWYNPLAISLFLRAMMDERRFQASCPPRVLFDELLSFPGFIEIDRNAHPAVAAAYQLIGSLAESREQDHNDEPTAVTVACHLALCSGTFDGDFYDLASHSSTSLVANRNSVLEMLLKSAWVEKLGPSNGDPVIYYRIHPIMLNTLRSSYYRNHQGTPEIMSAFTTISIAKALTFTLQPDSPAKQIRTELEALNILTAFKECMKSLESIEGGMTTERDEQPWGALEALTTLKPLWTAALKSHTPALTTELTLPRLLALESFLENRLMSGNLDPRLDATNVEILLEVSVMLAQYYMERDSVKADSCTSTGLFHVTQHPDCMRSWDGSVWYNLNRSLIFRGFQCMNEKNFLETKNALELVIRVAYVMERSSPEKYNIDFARVRRSAALVESPTHGLGGEIGPRGNDKGLAPQFGDVVEVTRQMHDLALFRHAAFTGLRKAAEHLGLGNVDDYDEKATFITPFIVRLNPPDLANDMLQAGFDNKRDFDMRDLSLEALGVGSTVLSVDVVANAQLEIAKGQLDLAKATLLAGIGKAMLFGDARTESECQRKFADLAIDQRDWKTAVRPIRRLLQLHNDVSGGPSLRSHVDHRLFDFARYGTVMLRHGDFWTALDCFELGVTGKAVTVKPHRSVMRVLLQNFDADDMVDFCLYLTRFVLIILLYFPLKLQLLKRKPITPDDFRELDDIMQNLLLHEVAKIHPGYNIDDPALRKSLDRAFTVTSTQLESADTVINFCRPEILTHDELAALMGDRGINGEKHLGFLQEAKKLKSLSNFAEEKGVETGRPIHLISELDYSGIGALLPTFEDSVQNMPDYIAFVKGSNSGHGGQNQQETADPQDIIDAFDTFSILQDIANTEETDPRHQAALERLREKAERRGAQR